MEGIKVLLEDNHLLGVNKPAGWLVQADETGDVTLSDWAKEYIKVRYHKPGDVFLGVVHRLDRPVSGAVIFARTSKGLSRMNALFRERKVHKTYVCLTSDRPDPISGSLKHFISKDRQKNKASAQKELSNRAKGRGAKESKMDYELIGEMEGKFLVKVTPHTGRPHQIRVQMAALGCPIIGDVKYGSPYETSDGSVLLHCRRMSFIHPVKQEPVEVIADLPEVPAWKVFEGVMEDAGV